MMSLFFFPPFYSIGIHLLLLPPPLLPRSKVDTVLIWQQQQQRYRAHSINIIQYYYYSHTHM
jgi:hypothetical protein